jgi:MoxR-like ATPase
MRIKCDYADPDLLEAVLLAGRKLENSTAGERPVITPEEIKALQEMTRKVDLSPILKTFVNLVHNLRNTGIKVSDRRAVKIQNLLAASAVMCGRTTAVLSDLWVVKYIWDTEDQVEILAGIIDQMIEKDKAPDAHPQALSNQAPNAEELLKEVNLLKDKWETGSLSFEEQNTIKDKLRYVQTRGNWVKNNEHKQFLQNEIEQLWHKILQTI